MRSTSKLIVITLLLIILSVSLTAESRGLKFLQSLAVPGLSQVRSGRDYGYAMLAAEAGIISGIFFLNAEENLKAQEYYEYALKFAHIQPGDYPDQFFRDLSRYDSSGFEAGGYNADVRQTAMQLYPDDPIAQQIYIDENIYPEDYAWNWDSSESRGSYSEIRIQTQDLRDYASMAIGVLIVNHLISGIDALLQKPDNSQVYLDIKDRNPMLMLSLEW